MEFNTQNAQELLNEHVKDEYQKLHSKMVATGLKAYAQKLNEDENLWFITGLLHDLDYFEFPNEHPTKSIEWFKQWNFPDELIHAVEAHAHERTNVTPNSKLAGALLATDELAGFLYAYSLMRPEGFTGMKASSIKKKFKDKGFAKKIDREDIMFGIESFGVDFNEHVSFLIDVYQNMEELKA